MPKVVIVGFKDAQVLDITGPIQVFASANDALGTPHYELVLAGADGPLVETTCGLGLQAVPLTTIQPSGIDTLLISGGDGVRQAVENPALLDWVRPAAPTCRRMGSVCSGTFVLAAAGLADGHRVATHWDAARLLGRLYPALTVDADALYVTDGKLWTSAGVTAGIDMALALVEADLGRDIALGIARRLVVYAHRPGNQSQFSTLLEGQTRAGGRFAATIDWMAAHMADPVTVRDAAAHAGMSERSFHRHFVAETGETPARYLERLRLDSARALLERPGLPLKTVAAESGFGSAGRLIQVFERRFGMSPTAYRQLHGR